MDVFPSPKRVLIDASKLLDLQVDGIRRYVEELLKAIRETASSDYQNWEIDVCLEGRETLPLSQIVDAVIDRKPLLDSLPRLLRHNDENPIHVSKNRLEKLKQQQAGHLRILRERMRLQTFRLAKICVKRAFRFRTRHSERNNVYDVIHLPLPNTWASYCHLHTPFVTTVHDLSHLVCPHFQKQVNIHSLSSGLEFSEKVNSRYISDSHSTKQQMVQLMGVPSHRIDVIHLACDRQHFQPSTDCSLRQRLLNKYKIPDQPFMLSVGTKEPRKNLLGAVRAYRKMREKYPDTPIQFVIAGGDGWGNQQQLKKVIQNTPGVHPIGYVENDDLPTLYSAASFFVYVSYYEGFGLPLLEAMSCGLPVVYGDNSSMPEVVGEAGLPAAVHDVHQICQQIETLYFDLQLQKKLAAFALRQAERFCWRQTAQLTLDSYARTIDSLTNTFVTKPPCTSMGDSHAAA